MRTNLIKLSILLICSVSFAQEHITLNTTQDARLLFVGDEKGNEAGTINLTFRSEWQGKQQKYGFMFVAPEFEYADLQGGIYRRYSMNVGYTFNKFLDDWRPFELSISGFNLISFDWSKFEYTASIGIGTIDYNGAYYSFGSNFQLGYQIGNRIVFFLDLEIVDRLDLQVYEVENLSFGDRLRASGKFGIKVNLR